MAAADSAQSSALATATAANSTTNGTGSNTKSARQRNASPPAQTKRDKKFQNVNDRLSALAAEFSRDRDRQYREELHKMQVDVTLVGRVDPYADRPLEEIDALGPQLRDREREREREPSLPTSATAATHPARSLLELAGPSFHDWTDEIQDAVEHRDYNMTSQKYEYERKMQDHRNNYAYRVEVARREHKALSNTLRDRLMNSIQSKRIRLTREKEALEISDSSAHLLHPNQFTLTNPASPGGNHGKRNTRQRRDVDDLPGFAADNNKKRKRNAANGASGLNDDEGSPAPARPKLDAGSTTPLWHNDRLRGLRKDTGPVYSIDKLFTDRELSMTYNTAALAAHKHLLTRRDQNGDILPSPDDSDTATNGDHNGSTKEDDDPPTSSAMERQPSHATRSTRGQNTQNLEDKVLGLEGLANFELPANLDRMSAQEPKLPPLIHSQYSKAYVKSDTNTPAALPMDDAAMDIQIMNTYKYYQKTHGVGTNLEQDSGGRRLLENVLPGQHGASRSASNNKYVALVPGARGTVEQLCDSLGVPASSALREDSAAAAAAGSSGMPALQQGGVGAVAAALANGSSPRAGTAVPMSRQSSLGGAAMSRQSSARGRRK